MITEEEKLDNPVYYSLTETHKSFAIDYKDMKFYHPDFCPFGGCAAVDKSRYGISKYAKFSKDFYVVGHRPHFDGNLEIKKELVCNQMLLERPLTIKISERIIELQEDQADELLALVNLVQPGYFKKKTTKLGRYYGIYKNGMLVAVAGERMKMDRYTEVSAIVTHPEHTAKGYAKQLIAHAVNEIFLEDRIPYLHVANTNLGAIGLYEKLGFTKRREISFWNFGPAGSIL